MLSATFFSSSEQLERSPLCVPGPATLQIKDWLFRTVPQHECSSLPSPDLVSFCICNFFPCLSELVSVHCRRYAPSCLANDQWTHAKAKKPHASPARQHLLVHCSSAWLCISVEHIHGFHVITMLVLFTLEAPATTISPAFPLQRLPGTAMFVLVQMWG